MCLRSHFTFTFVQHCNCVIWNSFNCRWAFCRLKYSNSFSWCLKMVKQIMTWSPTTTSSENRKVFFVLWTCVSELSLCVCVVMLDVMRSSDQLLPEFGWINVNNPPPPVPGALMDLPKQSHLSSCTDLPPHSTWQACRSAFTLTTTSI